MQMHSATTTVTTTPRQGSGGITRSKLEVDEGIAVSLVENNGAPHEEPNTGYDPPWRTRHRSFQRDVAQQPVRDEQRDRNDRYLQDLAGTQKRVACREPAEHSRDHSVGDFEVRSAEVNPRDQDGDVGR